MSTAPLHERALETILADITEGRLAPGAPVDRKATAQRLGMSLAPVHMAVNQLAADGFVVSLPRRGTHVRGYGPEDIRGHRVVRMALEVQAARMYAGDKITDARADMVRLARAAQNTRQPQMDRVRADIAFHRALVDLAGVPMLSREFARVMNLGMFLAACGVLQMSNHPRDSHVGLVDDLCDATPRQAEARIRRHVRNREEKR